MNKKNTTAMLKKFDYMFRLRHLPMSQTTMCWLFECNDGWKKLLWDLCTKLQCELDKPANKMLKEKFAVTQVKEKYGTLRFYTNGFANNRMSELISNAELESSVTCELCGKHGGLCVKGAWVATRCKKHMKEEGYKEVKDGHQ